MNVVNLHGRLTKEPLIRKTQSGKDVAQFYLAVDSHRKDAQGNTKADFIPCTMWNKLAELARLYLHKGSEIVVAGELHSGNYKGQDGQRHYTLDVWASSFDFCGKKTDSNAEPLPPAAAEMGQPIHEEDIPF